MRCNLRETRCVSREMRHVLRETRWGVISYFWAVLYHSGKSVHTFSARTDWICHFNQRLHDKLCQVEVTLFHLVYSIQTKACMVFHLYKKNCLYMCIFFRPGYGSLLVGGLMVFHCTVTGILALSISSIVLQSQSWHLLCLQDKFYDFHL